MDFSDILSLLGDGSSFGWFFLNLKWVNLSSCGGDYLFKLRLDLF